ncbi:MAG: carboxypeptidase regulatory-like domain-containing protein [Chloroflexota bacterium]
MQCKSCGVTAHGKYDFCPNCGAYVKHQSEHALPVPKFDRKQSARADQPQAKAADKSAQPLVAPPPGAPTPTTLAVRPSAQPMAHPRPQSVRAKRRDPFATYAGAIIFMGVWFLALLIGFGAAGVYQGAQDRSRIALETSAQHKQLAKEYIKQGNTELAIEELKYARQFNPKDREISELLASLQPLAPPSGVAPTAVPLAQVTAQPTLLPSPAATKALQDALLNAALADARKAYDAKEYEAAAAALEGVHRTDPNYKKSDVDEMLYTSYVKLARQYLGEERWEEAIQKFDKALAVRKNDDVTLERYLAATYVRGLSSWDADWKRTVESFAEIVKINPEYLDSRARLYQGFIAYGDFLMEHGRACAASEQYAGAQAMGATPQLESKQAQAKAACGAPPSSGTTTTPVPNVTRAPPAGAGKYTVQVNGTLLATGDDTASIRGIVVDKIGKPIASLKLTVLNRAGNYSRDETTDPGGLYSFDGLDPGEWMVSVSGDPSSVSPFLAINKKQRAQINFTQN